MTKARENSDYTGLAADIVAGDTAARAGRKNLILNGGFDVWQRGAGPFSGYSYGPDRFRAASTANRGSDSNEGYVAVMTGNPTGGAALWTGVELAADALSQFKIGSTYTISARVKSASRISAVVNYRPSGVAGGHTVDSTFNSSDYKGGNNVYETLTWTFSPDTLPLTGDVHLTVVFKTESANDCTFSQVQLELGSVATDFEHRSYGEILADCQRYFERINTEDSYGFFASGTAYDSNTGTVGLVYTTKRAKPTLTFSSVSHFKIQHGTTGMVVTNFASIQYGLDRALVDGNGVSGLTQNSGVILISNNAASAYIEIDAEL